MKQWESNAEKNHLSNAMRIVHTSLAARKNRQVFAWTEMLIRTRNQRGWMPAPGFSTWLPYCCL